MRVKNPPQTNIDEVLYLCTVRIYIYIPTKTLIVL